MYYDGRNATFLDGAAPEGPPLPAQLAPAARRSSPAPCPVQGQGDANEFNEQGLSAAFWVNLTIFQKKIAPISDRFHYHHFDPNSGCGFNEQSKCIGSPLAFLRAT